MKTLDDVGLCNGLNAWKEIVARAYFFGERIDLRSFTANQRPSSRPVTLQVANESLAVLFRYGAAVLFHASPESERALRAELATLITQPCDVPETEQITVRVDPSQEEGIRDGTLWLRQLTTERSVSFLRKLRESCKFQQSVPRIGRSPFHSPPSWLYRAAASSL